MLWRIRSSRSRVSPLLTIHLRFAIHCHGHFPFSAFRVRKYRAEAENGGQKVIYLNAGDTYSEAPWFTVFKDNISAAFLNVLKPDVIVSEKGS